MKVFPPVIGIFIEDKFVFYSYRSLNILFYFFPENNLYLRKNKYKKYIFLYFPWSLERV